jgi:hypothetical protein
VDARASHAPAGSDRSVGLALAFEEHGRLTYFGPPDLVQYLASRGVDQWTHTLDV